MPNVNMSTDGPEKNPSLPVSVVELLSLCRLDRRDEERVRSTAEASLDEPLTAAGLLRRVLLRFPSWGLGVSGTMMDISGQSRSSGSSKHPRFNPGPSESELDPYASAMMS